MAVKELSLRMKILLACLTLFVAFAILSLTVRVIKERLPFMQFYGYEVAESSDAAIEMKTVKDVICQNGKYRIYKPKPFGFESVAHTINNVLDSIESAAREFITGRR